MDDFQTAITNAVIVSDLHVGLPQFRRDAFMEFVASLSPDTALILNGDTVDRPGKPLSPEDQGVLDFLRDQSYVRNVIWLTGNHGDENPGGDSGRIRYQRQLRFGSRLLVIHGDDFDNLKPRAYRFLVIFSHFHKYLVQLGAPPIHVAEFAKRWLPFLYRVLTRKVRAKAVEYAKRQNVTAITCGHTHQVEDCVCEGIHYMNTGAWTELPLCYVRVTKEEVELIKLKA